MVNYILPITAIIVSIIAVTFSIWYNRRTLKMTKKHYKKSVKPLLCVWNESFPNSFKLFLRNGGTGPAIIKNIVLKVSNKSYQTMDEVFKDKDHKIKIENYDQYETKIAKVENYALLPNGEVILFEYRFKNEMGRQEFNQLVKKVTLFVNYETIYKKPKIFKEEPISNT
jgi:hypothetical protein